MVLYLEWWPRCDVKQRAGAELSIKSEMTGYETMECRLGHYCYAAPLT